jgi:hypothetical protein
MLSETRDSIRSAYDEDITGAQADRKSQLTASFDDYSVQGQRATTNSLSLSDPPVLRTVQNVLWPPFSRCRVSKDAGGMMPNLLFVNLQYVRESTFVCVTK